MNIIGIGTDIVSLARIRAAWERFGNVFAQRILMPSELSDFVGSAQPIAFLAKRFAAKEAFAKACGFGFREGGITLRDIGIDHNAVGKPLMVYSEQASHLIRKLKLFESHITISDEREYAVAFVLLIGKE